MANGNLFYWDANVFIYYLNGNPERLPKLDAILDAISRNKKDKIVTSIFSKVEVAWVASEKNNRSLSQDEESKYDTRLFKFSELIHIAIKLPVAAQPTLGI